MDTSSWTPAMWAIYNQIQNGNYDFTYGPGSPDPTNEDLNTIYGNHGNILQEGQYAIPQELYNAFSPEERQALGIADIAPSWHGTRLERFFGAAGRAANTLAHPVRAFRNWMGDGGSPDYSPDSYLNSSMGPIPYFGEGSPMSQTLGPLLENAFPNDSGDQIRNIISTEFSNPSDLQASNNPFTAILHHMPAYIAGQELAKLGKSAWHGILSRLAGGPGGNSNPGAASNANSGGYYSPEYLHSIGYEPGQGEGSLWPGMYGAGGEGGFGVGGAGGSFFHDLAGVRGGPLAGSFSPYFGGGGGPSNLSFGWRPMGVGQIYGEPLGGFSPGELGGGPHMNMRKS